MFAHKGLVEIALGYKVTAIYSHATDLHINVSLNLCVQHDYESVSYRCLIIALTSS